MSYTPSEDTERRPKSRRGVPAARGTPSTQNSRVRRTLRQREIEDLAQNSPLVPQADLGEAVPAHEELFLRFELFGVIDERNGSEGVPPPEEAGTLF